MSCFDRPDLPAANAVRARNDGAKPRLTNANAPFFRKTLRDCIIVSIRSPERLALLLPERLALLLPERLALLLPERLALLLTVTVAEIPGNRASARSFV